MKITNEFVGRLQRAEQPHYALAARVGLSPVRLSRLIHNSVTMTPNDHDKLVQLGKTLGLKPGQCFR